MADWNKYGALGSVVITAGAVITGVLWYDRASSQIRAEDYAELLAAKWERGMVFQDEQSAPYEWNAGTVSLRVVKSKIEAAVDGLVDCILPDDAFVWGTWLDTENALPADGGTAVVYNAEWHVMTTNQPGLGTYWTLGGNDDAYCLSFRTLNTRAVEFGPGINVPGHTNSLVPVAVLGRLFTGNDGEGLAAGQNSYFWGGQGAWWTYAGLGTNVFVLPHDVIWPVRTNVLCDARVLATAMKRSARWYTLGDIATNIITTTRYGAARYYNTNRNDGVHSPTAAEYRAVVTGMAEADSRVDVLTNYPRAVIADVHIETQTYHYHDDPANPFPGELWDVFCDCTFSRTAFSNIVPEYPSPQMIASGMVDRVRIYLVAMRDEIRVAWPLGSDSFTFDNGMIVVYEDDGDTLLTDWTLDGTKPNSYQDEDLGTGFTLCPIPEMSQDIAMLGYESQWESYTNNYFGLAYPNAVIVNMVYDSGDGGPVTNRPCFNIGADFYTPDIEMKQMMMEDVTYGAKGLPKYRYYQKWERQRYDHAIKVTGFIIVVDWNFKHLTDTPYVPTPHMPEWLSTNAP
jgi:hypothetical protein